MDFFDRVREAASNIKGTTEKKSKELYNITKLKVAIADKQSTVKKIYREIGYEAYKAYKEGADVQEAIIARLKKIDSIEDYIASLNKQIDDIKTMNPVGVDDIESPDELAEEADFEETSLSDDDEIDAEPIEPIE